MGNFRENLIRLRKAKYPSARQFALTLGISYKTYMTYESKIRSAEPKYEMLIKIASLLGVSTDELLGYVSAEKFDSSKEYEQFQETNAKIVKLLNKQQKTIIKILNRLEELEAEKK